MSGATSTALVRAPRQPCRPHTTLTVTRRAFTAISTQARASRALRVSQRTASTGDASRKPERPHRLPSAHGGAAAAAVAALALHASVLLGAALAEDVQPLSAPGPSLPSPPEIVRTLSESIFSGPDADTPEAPPLKDEPANGASGGDGSQQQQQNGAAKQQGQKQEQQDASRDEKLQKRFESEILPKIQEQLKALDQNEQPNATTIELKRQLRRAEDDIYRLLEDLKGRKSDAAQAEASGLAREFEDIRSYVKENGGQLADEEKGS